MKQHKRILEIDGLRGLALLGVLLYHARVENFFEGGFLGVDVFFVISGYVVTISLLRLLDSNTFDYKLFVVRRIIRLCPSLFVMIAISNIAAYQIFIDNHTSSTGYLSLSASTYFSNTYLWMKSGYFDIDSRTKLYLHTWSLSTEWQFYLSWALLARTVFFNRKNLRTEKTGLLIVFLIVLICATSIVRYFYPIAAFYNTVFRYDEFMIGSLLAWCKYNSNDASNKTEGMKRYKTFNEILSMFSLCGIIGLFIFFDEKNAFLGSGAVPISICTAILISFCANTSTGFFLQRRVAQFIGRISYSVYLIHWPILVFIDYYRNLQSTALQRIFGIIASIPCGILLHYFVEVPFQRKFSRITSLTFTASLFVVIWIESLVMIFTLSPVDSIGANLLQRTQPVNEGRYLESFKRNGFLCHGTGVLKGELRFNTCNPPRDNEILLVGDSHAGDIYGALKEVLKNTTIVQLTADSCNIHSLIKKPQCYSIHNVIKRYLRPRRSHLKAIIIGSKWNGITKDEENILHKKVSLLKERLNNSNIFIIGPRPALQIDPSHIIKLRNHSNLIELKRDFQNNMLFDLSSMTTLKTFCNRNNYTFINAYESFCSFSRPILKSPVNCTFISDDQKYLLYYDKNHYNIMGARKLVSSIYPYLTDILSLSNKREPIET